MRSQRPNSNPNPGNGGPWEWGTLGMADPGNGEPWEWGTLGMAGFLPEKVREMKVPNKSLRYQMKCVWVPITVGEYHIMKFQSVLKV